MRKGFINSKVSRFISSFKSCRSKHPSSLPSNPIPCKKDEIENTHIRRSRDNKPSHFSLKRHVASAITSARRSFSSPRPSAHFRWEKQPDYHVIAKVYNYDSTPPRPKIYTSSASASASDDVVLLPSPPPPPLMITKHKKRRRVRRRRYRDDECGSSTCTAATSDSGRESPASPARLSEFMRKMNTRCREDEDGGVRVEGKVRESYAVVKRSEDPYVDFRRSMAEMVVEKGMFERKDMEELLSCFLSLNSEHLHGVIVTAFVDIWETLFSNSSSPIPVRSSPPLTRSNMFP